MGDTPPFWPLAIRLLKVYVVLVVVVLLVGFRLQDLEGNPAPFYAYGYFILLGGGILYTWVWFGWEIHEVLKLLWGKIFD